jgi:hypothetical protein
VYNPHTSPLLHVYTLLHFVISLLAADTLARTMTVRDRGRRFIAFGLSRLCQLRFDLAFVGFCGHCSLWTQSAKLTADSVGRDEIAGLSGLSRLNSRPKQWPQFSHREKVLSSILHTSPQIIFLISLLFILLSV